MAFHFEPTYPPLPTQPVQLRVSSSLLRNFGKQLAIVAVIEAVIAVASFVVLYLLQLSPYFLLLGIPAVCCVAFYISFSISRQTGKIGLSLRASLLTNMGYFIGLIIVGALAFVVQFSSTLNTYDGILSTIGMFMVLGLLAIFMCGVEFVSLLVSIGGGLLGFLVGKWRMQLTLRTSVKDEQDVIPLNIMNEQVRTEREN